MSSSIEARRSRRLVAGAAIIAPAVSAPSSGAREQLARMLDAMALRLAAGRDTGVVEA